VCGSASRSVYDVVECVKGKVSSYAQRLVRAVDRVENKYGVRIVTPGDSAVIESFPQALAETQTVASMVNLASTYTGINVDAVNIAAKRF